MTIVRYWNVAPGLVAYLQGAEKVRPIADIVFSNQGIPTGQVIESGRESIGHDVFANGYMMVTFRMPEEKHYSSWAGTLVHMEGLTDKIEDYEYLIDRRWVAWPEIAARGW